MIKKQKLRNTNQFKKKKNKQKNLNKPVRVIIPPKRNITYHPETKNFNQFISKIEQNLFDAETNIIRKRTTNVDDHQTILFGNGKWEINETIHSNSVQFFTNKFGLEFTPYENGIQLFKIAVEPDYQKNGIGKKIMIKILEIANELNIEISLIPIPMGRLIPMEKLKKFYKELGFINDANSPYWKYSLASLAQNEIEHYQMAA